MIPTVIILTFNSEDTIKATLDSVKTLTDDVYVIDSGSKDTTLQIAEQAGTKVLQHEFVNYGAQRNWAIANVTPKYGWQLHLDADERLSPDLALEIATLNGDNSTIKGYFIPRYLRFLGKILRHNLAPTWHMRLFRNGFGECEQREYDQHFICSGQTAQLQHEMIDDIRMSLSEWTARHNRWADAEVRELLSAQTAGRIAGKLTGSIVERKRSLRGFYNRSPLFVRAFALFFYRYFGGGFLDGKEGFIFCVLQTLWYRMLVDAKLYEQSQKNSTI